MLTKLIIRNFKRFKDVEIELGNPVVFIGPNNSGKTSALQALSLWELGMRRWTEKRKGQKTPEKRPGVTINKRDLVLLPVPSVKLLWHGLSVRDVRRIDGRLKTDNVFMDIQVHGVSHGVEWRCGFEFYFANEEFLYCRPLRLSEDKNPDRLEVPKEAQNVRVAFLPPLSGLASNELRIDEGAINVRIGEGRTAEVLRNLYFRIYHSNTGVWDRLNSLLEVLFGCRLGAPEYVFERGEIQMDYSERGIRLDLSSSGRGCQHTMLILAYLYANPGAVLLLDEPDAHLEILRQRQIYQFLTEVARENNNQIIAASHSEVLLNEAASKDTVVAFTGQPHRMMASRKNELLKSLREIGFEQYYLAEQNGWVLYLEGETDLDILRAFAKRLDHQQALKALERPFVHYTTDVTGGVNRHFYPLKDAFPELTAVALFDRHDKSPADEKGLVWLMWKQREIESYLCYPDVLIDYVESTAKKKAPGQIFEAAEVQSRKEAMRKEIASFEEAMKTLKKGSPWDGETKVSDEFLTPLFQSYYEKLCLYNDMPKRSFHELVEFVPIENLLGEVKEKLDMIAEVAEKAQPVTEDD